MDKTGLAKSIVVIVTCALLGSCEPNSRAAQCASQYPRPTAARAASSTTPIPAWPTLPLYRPPEALPQIYSADSSVGWFRSLFYAHLDAFPGGRAAVRVFLLRFQARIVGRTDTVGWYAVLIPDPGPDTATINLLNFCIGVSHGVYVHQVYSRRPSFLPSGTASHVLSNKRLQLTKRALRSVRLARAPVGPTFGTTTLFRSAPGRIGLARFAAETQSRYADWPSIGSTAVRGETEAIWFSGSAWAM